MWKPWIWVINGTPIIISLGGGGCEAHQRSSKPTWEQIQVTLCNWEALCTENCKTLTTFPVRPHIVNISKLLSVFNKSHGLDEGFLQSKHVFVHFARKLYILITGHNYVDWLENVVNDFDHKYKMMMHKADSDLLVEICSHISRWILIKCQY